MGLEEEAVKKKAAVADLKSLVPEAIKMLKAGETAKQAFTKDKIKSLLSFVFKVEYKCNLKRKSFWIS